MLRALQSILCWLTFLILCNGDWSEPVCTKNRTRKLRLWKADPHCFYCGVVTYLPPHGGGRSFPDTATLDHLDSKLSGRRGQLHHAGPRTVLACYQCNHERGLFECRELYREEHRQRSMAGMNGTL